MSKRNITVMPGTQEILSQMGEQIKLARLRGVGCGAGRNQPCNSLERGERIAFRGNRCLCGSFTRAEQYGQRSSACRERR